MHTVNLLYSGGWDGTFRLLSLCQYDIQIQPIYIKDHDRASMEFEIKAMNKIIELSRERFNAKILDIKFYEKQWILNNCKNDIISKAFDDVHKKYDVGIQYKWFALLSKYLGNVKMESSVVHQYHAKVEIAINDEAMLIPVPNDFIPERYCVIPRENTSSTSILMENLILPVIKLTKNDEERIARENNWIDIMKLSWFCHSPINGRPCGLCGPCDDAMNTGMEWRMPLESQRRYKYKKIYKVARKVKRIIERRN